MLGVWLLGKQVAWNVNIFSKKIIIIIKLIKMSFVAVELNRNRIVFQQFISPVAAVIEIYTATNIPVVEF